MIEKAFWADRKKKEKARNPHDSWLFWQGQKDLNPRHAVLETAALPAELYPYIFKAYLLYHSGWDLSTFFYKKRSRILLEQEGTGKNEKNRIFLKKGLAKSERMCYYNQALRSADELGV